MSGEVRLVDDGPEDVGPHRDQGIPWRWLTLGLALGLAVGVLFLGPGVRDGVKPGGVPVTAVSAGEAPSDSPGVGDVLTGFPGALVAVVWGEGRSLAHLIWPLRGPQILRAMPSGGFGDARFDVSGRWLALTTPIPEDQGAVLSYGQAPNLLPLVAGVTGFAWHDSNRASLAYTRSVDEQDQLWVVGPDRKPEVVVSSTGLGPVVLWGQWGFVLQGEEKVVLLTPDGDRKATVRGRALASHPSGWILMTDESGLKLVSAGGGVKRLRISTNVGVVATGAISPDFTRVAVVGSRKAVVAGLEGDPAEEVVIAPDFFAAPSQVAWSSDSRFVMVPLGLGVWVFDREEEVPPHRILESHSVLRIGVIPPDAP